MYVLYLTGVSGQPRGNHPSDSDCTVPVIGAVLGSFLGAGLCVAVFYCWCHKTITYNVLEADVSRCQDAASKNNGFELQPATQNPPNGACTDQAPDEG